jgi:hypothetical protein
LISVQIIRNALAMDLTSLDFPEKRVLRALFELARCDHPAQPDVLARALDLDLFAVDRALARLGAQGLADAARVRLTLAGLAVAVHVPALEQAALIAIGVRAEDDDRHAPEPLWRAGAADP